MREIKNSIALADQKLPTSLFSTLPNILRQYEGATMLYNAAAAISALAKDNNENRLRFIEQDAIEILSDIPQQKYMKALIDNPNISLHQQVQFSIACLKAGKVNKRQSEPSPRNPNQTVQKTDTKNETLKEEQIKNEVQTHSSDTDELPSPDNSSAET